MLLGAKGIASSNKCCFTSSNKDASSSENLLGAPGLTTRSKGCY